MPNEKTNAEWMHSFAAETIEKLEMLAMNSQDHEVPPAAVAEARQMVTRLWELFPPAERATGQRCRAFRCPACDQRFGTQTVFPCHP